MKLSVGGSFMLKCDAHLMKSNFQTYPAANRCVDDSVESTWKRPVLPWGAASQKARVKLEGFCFIRRSVSDKPVR